MEIILVSFIFFIGLLIKATRKNIQEEEKFKRLTKNFDEDLQYKAELFTRRFPRN